MFRPKALASWPSTWPTRWIKSGFHVAARSTPDGKAVEATTGSVVFEALVRALGPYHALTPAGPSHILMGGIPRRVLVYDSIQDAPASMLSFSSSVIRPRRSSTRCSTVREGFL